MFPIEKPNNVKNQKGTLFEIGFSDFFHKDGIPLLVSPLFLRRRGLGQIDAAKIIKTASGRQEAIVAECKFRQKEITLNQKKRLRRSCQVLQIIFEIPVELIFVRGFAKSFESAYPLKRNKIGELR